LKGFQIIATTVVGPDGSFELFATGLGEGDHTFSITGEDTQGRRSRILSFAVTATRDATVAVRNILLSPTLSADKSEVRKGDTLELEGESVPGAQVTLFIVSRNNRGGVFVGTASVTESGIWSFSLDTSTFELGDYSIRAHVIKRGNVSSLSPPVHITIGTRTIFAEPVICPLKGDLNIDCRVNLVDFSIAAFFYLKPLNAVYRKKEIERLSGDGVIDFIDFSLMAFYWTG